MYIYRNANINVGNLDHIFVEQTSTQNVNREAETSCRLSNP